MSLLRQKSKYGTINNIYLFLLDPDLLNYQMYESYLCMCKCIQYTSSSFCCDYSLIFLEFNLTSTGILLGRFKRALQTLLIHLVQSYTNIAIVYETIMMYLIYFYQK